MSDKLYLKDTHVIFVRFLSRVNSPVLIKPNEVPEGFPTVEGFLPGVTVPPVTNKGRVLDEGFPTLDALVRLLACVTPLVSCERGAITESLPTLVTLIGFLSGMSSLVSREGGALGEFSHIDHI